jgi:hypothetical protein
MAPRSILLIEADPTGLGQPERRPKRHASGAFAGLTPFGAEPYRYLFVGTALTMTGNFVQRVVRGWLNHDLTDSPTSLRVVSFARGIPTLLLTLPAGVLVDRFGRRVILIVAQGLTLSSRSSWPC